MEKRLVSSEFDAVKHFAAAACEISFSKTELSEQFKLVENGTERLEKCSAELNSLFNDLLATIPAKQLNTLRNAVNDYRFLLVPKTVISCKSVVMDKEHARELVELAQAECKMCVKTPKEAESCPVYSSSIGIVPPSSYDSLICPYAQTEWLD